MTDEQQRKIVKTVKQRIQTLLHEIDETRLSGEEQIDKLKEIEKYINEETTIRSLPFNLRENFGSAGLYSSTTVVACACFQKDTEIEWNTSAEFSPCPETYRVFKNRELGKHAEREMLEWLSIGNIEMGEELRIVISRSPCEVCLERIVYFLHSLHSYHRWKKICIGFANWYRGRNQRSNSHQMYESVVNNLGINYSILTQKDTEEGIFSTFFKPSISIIYTDWKKAMSEAWEDCYERTKESSKCFNCMFKASKYHCRACKLDIIRRKSFNKKSMRMARAVKIMLNLFGVHFVLWKWQWKTERGLSDDLFSDNLNKLADLSI